MCLLEVQNRVLQRDGDKTLKGGGHLLRTWFLATPLNSAAVVLYQRWERGRQHKEGREERRQGKEEVCVNPASDLGSPRIPYSQPLTFRIERERGETRRTHEEEGERRRRRRRGKGSCKTTMAISKTSQLEIVYDHSAPLPPSTTARSMQSHNRQSPDEWGDIYLGRGQNEGHLHPKRRFRRSFLAF